MRALLLHRLAHGLAAALLASSAVCLAQSIAAAPPEPPAPLPALGIDAKAVSVSGLSSGAFMAAQFEVAYARSLMGAGIVAGGPYGCAMGSVTTAALTCSCPYEDSELSGPLGLSGTSVSRLNCVPLTPQILADRARRAVAANEGHVDGLAGMRRHRVWLYWGEEDPVVDPVVVQGLARFYKDARVGVVKTVAGPHAGHAMPTAADGNCAVTRSPYINGCKLDGAGDMLRWIYKLPKGREPSTAPLSGQLRPFDQRPYRQDGTFDSLDDTGWLYVPKACAHAPSGCKLHVAFHGCEQGQSVQLPDGRLYGRTFVEQAGYNRWADLAGIVVLYPQVRPSTDLNLGSAYGFNPKGCWDFWGYTTPPSQDWQFGSGLPYSRRDAPQMRAVKAMIDALIATGP